MVGRVPSGRAKRTHIFTLRPLEPQKAAKVCGSSLSLVVSHIPPHTGRRAVHFQLHQSVVMFHAFLTLLFAVYSTAG